MTPAAPPRGDVAKFIAANATAALGAEVTRLALPLTAIFLLGAGAFEMGLLRAIGGAPYLALSLFAGVVVDRLRRRPLLVACDLGRAALLLTIPAAAVTDRLTLVQLYCVAATTGALTVLTDIAALSFVPSLVGRDALVRANSLLHLTGAVARVAGPGFAGILLQLMSAPLSIAANAAALAASAALVALTRAQERMRAQRSQRTTFAEIGEGVRFVLATPVLRSLAAYAATYGFFNNMILAVFVLYATGELGIGAAGVGAIFMAYGVGSVLGTAVVGPVTRTLGTGRTIIYAALLAAGTAAVIPLAPAGLLALPVIALAQFLTGAETPIYGVTQLSLRQRVTPNQLLGRMNSTRQFIVQGAGPLGALLGGALGEVIGLRPTLAIAATGIALAVLWLLVSPLRSPEAHWAVDTAVTP